MRPRFAMIALALALSAPAADALALGDVVPLPAVGGTGESAPAASPAGVAHLLTVLFNDTGGAMKVRLRVSNASTGAILIENVLDVPAGSVLWDNESLPPSNYSVEGSVRGAEVPGLPFMFSAQSVVDTRACDGAWLDRFDLDGSAISTTRVNACQVPPRGFAAFESLARADASVPPGAGSVVVPAMRDHDAGEFALWKALAPVDRSRTKDVVAFAWRANATFPDASGGMRRGFELAYNDSTAPTMDCGLSVDGPTADLVPIGRIDHADATHAAYLLRFPLGARRSIVTTAFGGGCAAGVTSEGAGTSARLLRRILYTPPTEGPACLFAADLEATEIHEGDTLPADATCLAGGVSASARWVAGKIETHDGHRAIPLSLVLDATGGRSAGGTSVVARMWLASDAPYPIEAEAYAVRIPCCTTHVAYRLDRLASGGAPVFASRAAETPSAPPGATEPLSPLEGPSLSAPSRIVFPLADASRAARSLAATDGLATVLAEPDAALVGGKLAMVDESGDRVGATPTWYLLFGARAVPPVGVVCRWAATAVCQSSSAPPSWARDLGVPPQSGAADLPERGASFDEAFARWRLADPFNSSRANFSLYRAWGADGGTLSLGVAFVALDNAPAIEARGDLLSLVEISLVSARTLYEVVGVSHTSPLVDARSLGSVTAIRAESAPALARASSAPLFAAAFVVALGLLAVLLLWAPARIAFLGFFTRLVRSRVLDQTVRARIYALVGAEPGIHANAVAERLGLAKGHGEYHLGVLTREGWLTCVESPGFRRYFVAGKFSPAEMRALGALRGGQAERLYRIIEANPGITLGQLAAQGGVTMPTASKTVKKLVASGVVARTQDGRVVRLAATGS